MEGSPTWLDIFKFEKKLMAGGGKQIFFWLFLIVVSGASSIIPSLLLKFMADNALPTGNLKLVLYISILIGIAVFISEIGKAASIYFLDRVIVQGTSRLNLDIFAAIQQKDINSIKSIGRDSVYQRIADGVIKVREAMQLFLGEFLFYIVATFLGAWVLYFIDPMILIILLTVYVPYIIYRHKMFKRMGTNWNGQIESYAQVIKVIRESIEGIQLIKASNSYDFEERRLNRAHTNYINSISSHLEILCRGAFFNMLMFLLPEALVYLYLGYQILNQDQPIGNLLATIGIVSQFRNFIWHTSRMAFHREEHGIHIKRIEEILNLPDDPYKDNGVTKLLKGEITFKNVSFSFNSTTQVLNNVSLTIPEGKRIGIVGISGVGKSTFANLIVGMENPKQGEILVDNIPISNWDIENLRGQISYISQDTYLINGTIRNNLIYGLSEITDLEITQAIEAADLEGVITGLEDGIDTIIGEGGIRLSGGQRQRLSIARAYLRNPKILILDETTASLDLESERKVQRIQSELQNGKTTIVIAHRLVTLKDLDDILVLEDGKVVESGTHVSLLLLNGKYASLYKQQWTGGKEGIPS